MIRLVLVLLFLIIVWLLFIARLSRTQRIVAVVVMCILFAGAVWFDDNRKRPKGNLLAIDDVSSCGIKASQPYRSNYDFTLCFNNQSNHATARRLSFTVTASHCLSEPCQTIETVSRELPVTIAAGDSLELQQSLKFDAVVSLIENGLSRPEQESTAAAEVATIGHEDIKWSVTVVGVKATPN